MKTWSTHFLANVAPTRRMARLLAEAYRSPAIDELEAAGLEGLRQAALTFDPAAGVPFWGYARHRIRGAILDRLRKRARRHAAAPMVQLSELEWNSLPAAASAFEDHFLWANVWRILGQLDRCRETLTHVRYRNRHSPSRREVFELFYVHDVSMEEIGEYFGCSESRISQIHGEALAVLRRRIGPIRPAYRPVDRSPDSLADRAVCPVASPAASRALSR